MSWRNSRDYRVWRAIVIRRDKVCRICGKRQHRQAHHLDSGSYYPERRFDPDNGACLCRRCHLSLFHGLFKGGSRKKCTVADWERFERLVNKAKEIQC